jgi:hypothetical protein
MIKRKLGRYTKKQKRLKLFCGIVKWSLAWIGAGVLMFGIMYSFGLMKYLVR